MTRRLPPTPLFQAGRVDLLHDGTYLPYVLRQIRLARKRILAVQFLTDLRAEADTFGIVRHLMHSLAVAAWRGLEVRLLLNRLPTGEINSDGNHPCLAFLQKRGVLVQSFVPRSTRRILHTKAIVIDDKTVILGTHNWSPSAFFYNYELSVAVESVPAAKRMHQLFDGYWRSCDKEA